MPVSHHLMQSEIGVLTTPKRELVKEWLLRSPSHRHNPADSDRQPIYYSEENVQSDESDDDINYMLGKINKNTQEPPPIRKSKSSTTITTKAEVYRPFDENELKTNSSVSSSDKKGDYAKIVASASTSGDSRPFVQIDSYVDDPKILPPFDKITQLSSASPESFPAAQHYGESVPMQRRDSIDRSSDTTTDVSSTDTPPYLSNKNMELYKTSNYDNIVNIGKKVYVSPPSIPLSSHSIEGSSASFQGKGYLSEESTNLLGSIAATDESTHSQLNSNYRNPNTTTGFCHVI